MAASVVRDSITWPQGSISHETAQFGRFTDLDVMPRIAKNEASPNALRPVSRSPKNRPERGAGKNSGNCATSCVAKASFFSLFFVFPPAGRAAPQGSPLLAKVRRVVGRKKSTGLLPLLPQRAVPPSILAPPAHYVDFSITSPHANRLQCTVSQLLQSFSSVSLHFS